jgi:hypothetical protein
MKMGERRRSVGAVQPAVGDFVHAQPSRRAWMASPAREQDREQSRDRWLLGEAERLPKT